MEDQIYKNKILFLLTENIDELDIEINWTYNVSAFGQDEEKELRKGGKTTLVKEADKLEYIKEFCQMKLIHNTKSQIEAFLEGFDSIIPFEIIKGFDWKELQLMLCGLPDFDGKPSFLSRSERPEKPHRAEKLLERRRSDHLVLGHCEQFHAKKEGAAAAIRDRYEGLINAKGRRRCRSAASRCSREGTG